MSTDIVASFTLLNIHDLERIVIYYHAIFKDSDIIFNFTKNLVFIDTVFDNVEIKFYLPKGGFMKYYVKDNKDYSIEVSVKKLKDTFARIDKKGVLSLEFRKNEDDTEMDKYHNGTLIMSQEEDSDISLVVKVADVSNMSYIPSLRGYDPKFKILSSCFIDKMNLLKVNLGNYNLEVYDNGMTLQSSQERDGQMCLVSLNMENEDYDNIIDSNIVNGKYMHNIVKLKPSIKHGITEVHYMDSEDNYQYYILKISYALCGFMYFYIYPNDNA